MGACLTTEPKVKFSAQKVKDTREYKSIKNGTNFLYSVMWSPPTAQHIHSCCRKISQSDLAHIKGYYGGNVAYRLVPDANRHMCPLVAGYIIGNESESAHVVVNQFTKNSIPAYDQLETKQVDIYF